MRQAATTLTQLADKLWIAETSFKALGIDFGNRMTVMQTAAGDLFLHSPVRAHPRLFDAVRNLGTVAGFISPNHFHHLHISLWREAFPAAPVFAPASQHKIRFDRALSDGPLPGANGDIFTLRIEGCPRVSEHAFVHTSGRTLVLTDLAFNFHGHTGAWSRCFFTLYGAHGHLGPTRLIKMWVKDRAAFRRSLARVLDHDFDRIIVSHGAIVERDGREAFMTAFADYLK